MFAELLIATALTVGITQVTPPSKEVNMVAAAYANTNGQLMILRSISNGCPNEMKMAIIIEPAGKIANASLGCWKADAQRNVTVIWEDGEVILISGDDFTWADTAPPAINHAPQGAVPQKSIPNTPVDPMFGDRHQYKFPL